MHEVTQFQFNSQEVRVLINDSGEPLWVAKDVCKILGYTNHNKTIKDHCRAKGVTNSYPLCTAGGKQKVTCIDEGNLYRLIIKSTKKESEPFESWVCDEVLPTIRKTGSYSTQSAPSLQLLEGEIKEGASLLSQVIGRGELPETQKWQLVDRLFVELFGAGVEILTRPSTNFLQVYGPGPRMYFVDKSVPLLVLEHGIERDSYRVELSSACQSWFVAKCCNENQKAAASQQSLYKLFAHWFEESFKHAAPSFEVFHDAMIKRFSALSLDGEPWFVGVAPAVEVLA